MKILKSLFIVEFTLLFLAGCANLAHEEIVGKPNNLISNNGIILFTLVNNGGNISTTVESWNAAFLTKQVGDKSEDYTINSKYAGFRSSKLFYGFLPPGKYQLSRLEGYTSPFSANFDVNNMLPSIEIKAGEILDLGHLIYQPVGKNEVKIITATRASEYDDIISKLLPLYSKLQVAKKISFLERKNTVPKTSGNTNVGVPGMGAFANLISAAEEEANRPPGSVQIRNIPEYEEFITIAKSLTTNLNPARVTSGKVLWFGSNLGQILSTNEDRSWTRYNTPYMTEVTALQISGDTIVAAMEGGIVIESNDKGVSWKHVHTLELPSEIIDITKDNSNGWTIGTKAVKDNELTLTIVNGKTLSDLKVLYEKSFPYEPPTIIKNDDERYSIHLLTDKIIVSSTMEYIEIYDYSSNTWEKIKPPGIFDRVDVNGDQIIAFDMFGSERSTYMTTDYGDSWNSIPTFNIGYIFKHYWKNSKEAVFYTADRGLHSVDTDIMSTLDAGKSFKEIGHFENVCKSIYKAPKATRVYCTFNNGKTLSTLNSVNWDYERGPIEAKESQPSTNSDDE
jgi:hypothetical protein